MKKIAMSIFVAALVTAGMANAEIKIEGKNEQTLKVGGGLIPVGGAGVINNALGGVAKQNAASNQGNVTIEGDNKQTVDLGKIGVLWNLAGGSDGIAIQNISSNSSATE